jgi:hypothetical protein
MAATTRCVGQSRSLIDKWLGLHLWQRVLSGPNSASHAERFERAASLSYLLWWLQLHC